MATHYYKSSTSASQKEERILWEMAGLKDEFLNSIIDTLKEAEDGDVTELGSRILCAVTTWFEMEMFFELPVFWKTMLEVLLVRTSMLDNNRDYREVYKAITNAYIILLEQIHEKEEIAKEIEYFENH